MDFLSWSKGLTTWRGKIKLTQMLVSKVMAETMLTDRSAWFHDRHLLVALLLETRLSSGWRPCPRQPSRRTEISEAALHYIVVPVGFHRIDRGVVRCLGFQFWDAPIPSKSLGEIAKAISRRLCSGSGCSCWSCS